MERRTFIAVVSGGLLAAPLAVGAQQAGKVPRIGYLTGNSVENDKGLRSAFQQGLAELGYVDGKNVVIEARYAAGHFKRLPALAAELVQSKVDVIVVSATAIYDAREALAGVPTVFVIADAR